ncbi:MAG: rRNA pseudouridine synthase [Acidobacteriota bacterium]|nr:rRNA pseudouridine synthase [Acidobacteriota bacterium]
MQIRLQKILATAGLASRRAAEALMVEGRVSVNGEVVRELGTRADPAADDIRVDGRRIAAPPAHRYLLLNKPRGYLTTASDPQGRPTVLALLRGVRERVYPVGRLDYDSEGLLLLTNDGDLTARLTHPRHGVARVYEAHVRGVPDARALEKLAKGVVLDGRRTAPAEVRLAYRPDRHADHAVLTLTIREGRNRQVRRMCEAVGHPVKRLRRVAIGPLRDDRLPPGAFRDLTAREVEQLERATREPVATRPRPRSPRPPTPGPDPRPQTRNQSPRPRTRPRPPRDPARPGPAPARPDRPADAALRTPRPAPRSPRGRRSRH